jgi:hypothetical protein
MMSEHESVEYRLFFQPWLAQIPELYCQSSALIADRGILTTGNPELDRELLKQPRRMYLTIPQMAHYYDQGAQINMVMANDAILVYDLITEHLKRWKWVIQNAFNYALPPMQDFLLLDALAQGFHASVQCLGGGHRAMGAEMALLVKLTSRTLSYNPLTPSGPPKVVPLDLIYKPLAADIVRHVGRTR